MAPYNEVYKDKHEKTNQSKIRIFHPSFLSCFAMHPTLITLITFVSTNIYTVVCMFINQEVTYYVLSLVQLTPFFS